MGYTYAQPRRWLPGFLCLWSMNAGSSFSGPHCTIHSDTIHTMPYRRAAENSRPEDPERPRPNMDSSMHLFLFYADRTHPTTHPSTMCIHSCSAQPSSTSSMLTPQKGPTLSELTRPVRGRTLPSRNRSAKLFGRVECN